MKSRPEYGTFALRSDRTHHILISHAQGAMAVKRVLDGTVWSGLSIRAIHSGGTDDELFYDGLLEGYHGLNIEKFDSTKGLLVAVERCTGDSKAGTHCYLAGPEVFLWECYRKLRELGLPKECVSMELIGSKARRVTCVHCKWMNDRVTRSPHQCGGCGQWLLVRDHFSRLMGAYVGVRIDAEDPGSVPEQMEVFA